MRAQKGFVVETQATELCPELRVESVEEAAEPVPEAGGEEGGVIRFDGPGAGKLVKVFVTGQAVLYVRANGELVVDSRGY